MDSPQELASKVGTNATTEARMPARLRNASSAGVLPHNAIIATPRAISAPTKTERTGV